MLTEYITRQLAKAQYKILADSNFYGEIPGVPGVWASALTLEECRHELQEVLEDWLVLKVHSGEKVPGLKLHIDRRDFSKYA